MLVAFLIFILGVCLGSFLNVVIYRLHNNEPIINSRSHCMSCKKTLMGYELIPIASFIIQKGKCRNCKKRISWQYILVELATGLILVLGWLAIANLNIKGWWHHGYGAMWLLFIAVSIVVFVYDLKYFLIPDIVIYPMAIVVFLWDLSLITYKRELPHYYLASAIIPAAIFLSLILASRGRWMGMGDVKLVFLLGLFLGFPKIILALFLAFTSGSIVGLILILFKHYSFKSPIPFGIFLTSSALVALFYGHQIIEWYLRTIGVVYKF